MWVMGKNYLIKELKDLITEKYPYADNIINWQFYHINKNYNSINYLNRLSTCFSDIHFRQIELLAKEL